ncbi:Dsc3p [Sporobolomyces koalae]|uniref:Dsc3p n=1 Tax=Sporobolomyces koalae TaxID=500713 RepID=UPI003171F141
MPAPNAYTRLPQSEPFLPAASTSSYPPAPRTESLPHPDRPYSPVSLDSAYPPAPTASSRHAKGKARASEPWSGEHSDRVDDNDEGQPRLPKGLDFCVRFTDGTTEDVVDLWVAEKELVRDVKTRLRQIRSSTLHDEEGRPRRLRLIQLGRMLADGVLLVPYTVQLAANRKKLEQRSSSTADSALDLRRGIEKMGRVVKDVVQGESPPHESEASRMERGEIDIDAKGKANAEVPRRQEEQIWLHCSVGDAIEDDETSNEPSAPTEQTTPLQGFDRLREAGFSEEEIANMRAEFRERRNPYADPEGDTVDAEHQRALEEQWMSGMTGQEEAASDSSTGHYVTLLKGVTIGFLVPFLPLFFFRTQIFSRRMQMAIVLGLIINLSFGLLRLLG